MLSAAHVLAMDAKNLLDVIDSIRSRFPNLFSTEGSSRSNKSTPNNSATSSPSRKMKPQQQQQQHPPLPPPMHRITSPSPEQNNAVGPENMYQNSSEENQYQNLSNFNVSGGAQTQQPTIEASHAENLYANNEAGQQLLSQTKALELGDDKRPTTTITTTRPQVAAKPFNFNVIKVKSNFGNGSGNGAGGGGGANELKIIEDDLYSGGGGGGEGSCASEDRNMGNVKLPEPVACSIVQENIFKKNQSVLHK